MSPEVMHEAVRTLRRSADAAFYIGGADAVGRPEIREVGDAVPSQSANPNP